MRIIIQKYRFLVASIFLFTGLLIISSFIVSGKSSEYQQEITKDTQVEQNNENNESVDSIPIKTIFALICAGLIGLFCIPRNKNNKENFDKRNYSIKDNGDAGQKSTRS